MHEDSALEAVLTIDDWYDGPLAGFALYNGVPHHYFTEDFADDDKEERRYELVPVTTELLEAGLEAKAIFERWDAVRQRNNPNAIYSEAEFGALPEDRSRYAALRAMIEPLEAPDQPGSFIVRGRFELGCARVQWRDDSATGTV